MVFASSVRHRCWSLCCFFIFLFFYFFRSQYFILLVSVLYFHHHILCVSIGCVHIKNSVWFVPTTKQTVWRRDGERERYREERRRGSEREHGTDASARSHTVSRVWKEKKTHRDPKTICFDCKSNQFWIALNCAQKQLQQFSDRFGSWI